MIKLRFGEAIIQSCDVMLKDVIESKRVDRLIQMRAENVNPHRPTPYQVPPNTYARLSIHGFCRGFSGLLCGMRNSRCRIPWHMSLKNMRMSTRKSKEVANSRGWIIWARWKLILNFRIGLFQLKRLPCRHP